MYHDVEKQLKQNFDSLNPDLFSVIKDKSIPKIESEEELFSEMPVSRPHKSHVATYISAAVFLCIITTFFYINRSTAVGMIVVEASSSVTLSVDQYNKIIGVTSDNVEDEKHYSIYKGKDLAHGLENIFSDIIEEKSSDNTTDIKVTYHSLKNCEKTKKKVTETVENFSKNDGVYVEADYQSVGSSEYVEVEDNTGNITEDIAEEKTKEQDLSVEATETITEETEPSTEDISDDTPDSVLGTEVVEEEPDDTDNSSTDMKPEDLQNQDIENDQTMENVNMDNTLDVTDHDRIDEDMSKIEDSDLYGSNYDKVNDFSSSEETGLTQKISDKNSIK